MSIVRRAIGSNNTALYFEVPNSLFTLRDLGIWDIIYEHCGYFSASSLERLFTDSGFSVNDLREVFGRQFLSIEVQPSADDNIRSPGSTGIPLVATYANAFEKEYAEKRAVWKSRIDGFKNNGKRIVVWGAGSKGVTFLNMLRVRDEVTNIIDLNPHKQGKYVPGTGHQVVSPEHLKNNPPDTVIVMNPIYTDEIASSLKAMNVAAEIVVE